MISEWAKRTTLKDEFEIYMLIKDDRPSKFYIPPNIKVIAVRSLDEAVINEIDPHLIINHFPTNILNFDDYPQIWVVHGEYNFSRDITGRKPLMVFSNYKPSKMHKSWSMVPINFMQLGVDLDVFKPTKKNYTGKLTIGIVGRVHPDKIPFDFLKELVEYNSKNLTFQIYGGKECPEVFKTFKDIIKNCSHIQYIGEISPQEMPNIYKFIDILIVPSATDTGSYAIVEAMACGVPVIAKEVGGIAQHVGDAGILINSDKKLLKVLTYFAQDRAYLKELSIKARKKVVKYNNIEKHVEVWDRLISKAMLNINTTLKRTPSRTSKNVLERKKVTILMPCHNTPSDFLNESIWSLLKQTWTNFELLIIMDNCNMETFKTVKSFRDQRIKVLTNRYQKGIPGSMNTGIEASTTDYLFRMDSDDVAYPNLIERVMLKFLERPDVGACGVQIQMFGKSSDKTSHPHTVTKESAYKMSGHWFINNPGSCVLKNIAIEVGMVMPLPKSYAEDYNFWCKVLAKGYKICNLQEILLRYRVGLNLATNKNNEDKLYWQRQLERDKKMLE